MNPINFNQVGISADDIENQAEDNSLEARLDFISRTYPNLTQFIRTKVNTENDIKKLQIKLAKRLSNLWTKKASTSQSLK